MKPDGYVLRAPTPDDLEAVAAVLVADELDDAGHVVTGRRFPAQRVAARRPAARHRRLVALDEAATNVAYAQVTRDQDDVVSRGVLCTPRGGAGASAAPCWTACRKRAAAPAARRRAGALSPRRQRRRPGRGRAASSARPAPGAALWHMQIDLDGAGRAGPGAARHLYRPHALAPRPARRPHRAGRGLQGPLGPPLRAVRALGRGAHG